MFKYFWMTNELSLNLDPKATPTKCPYFTTGSRNVDAAPLFTNQAAPREEYFLVRRRRDVCFHHFLRRRASGGPRKEHRSVEGMFINQWTQTAHTSILTPQHMVGGAEPLSRTGRIFSHMRNQTRLGPRERENLLTRPNTKPGASRVNQQLLTSAESDLMISWNETSRSSDQIHTGWWTQAQRPVGQRRRFGQTELCGWEVKVEDVWTSSLIVNDHRFIKRQRRCRDSLEMNGMSLKQLLMSFLNFWTKYLKYYLIIMLIIWFNFPTNGNVSVLERRVGLRDLKQLQFPPKRLTPSGLQTSQEAVEMQSEASAPSGWRSLLGEPRHDGGFSPCSWGWTWGSAEPHEPAAGWTGSSCCPASPSPCRLCPPRPGQQHRSHRRRRVFTWTWTWHRHDTDMTQTWYRHDTDVTQTWQTHVLYCLDTMKLCWSSTRGCNSSTLSLEGDNDLQTTQTSVDSKNRNSLIIHCSSLRMWTHTHIDIYINKLTHWE